MISEMVIRHLRRRTAPSRLKGVPEEVQRVEKV